MPRILAELVSEGSCRVLAIVAEPIKELAIQLRLLRIVSTCEHLFLRLCCKLWRLRKKEWQHRLTYVRLVAWHRCGRTENFLVQLLALLVIIQNSTLDESCEQLVAPKHEEKFLGASERSFHAVSCENSQAGCHIWPGRNIRIHATCCIPHLLHIRSTHWRNRSAIIEKLCLCVDFLDVRRVLRELLCLLVEFLTELLVFHRLFLWRDMFSRAGTECNGECPNLDLFHMFLKHSGQFLGLLS